MITIRITNARQVVRKQKGRLMAALGGLVLDLDEAVEAVVVKRVQAALAEEGVEAIVERVPDPSARGEGPTTFPANPGH